MAIQDTDSICSIAHTIRRYLQTRPHASETLEGVAKWWLIQQRFNDSLEQVRQALDFLEQQGKVKKIQLSDGREVYRNSEKETKH